MSTDTRRLPEPLAPNAIRGWELRFVLIDMLAQWGGVLSVKEMAALLERDGYSLAGRPSQVISDALRLEIGKGRVRRVARGRYRFVGMPRSTAKRFHDGARRVAELRAFATERAFRS